MEGGEGIHDWGEEPPKESDTKIPDNAPKNDPLRNWRPSPETIAAIEGKPEAEEPFSFEAPPLSPPLKKTTESPSTTNSLNTLRPPDVKK